MRLYKRGNIWWYELDFNTKQIRKSTKTRNRVVAGQVASAAHLALIKGEVGIFEKKKAPTFREAMKAFLGWSAIEHHEHPATTKRYKTSSKALLAHFRDETLDRITPKEADDYKQKRSRAKGRGGKQLKPATVNRELACMRAMFNHAIKSSQDLRNPISKQTGVKLLAENNQQERVVTYTEEEKYLAAARQPLADIATLMVEQGFRPEEVCKLKASVVDLDRNTARVTHGKTPSARRLIELTPRSHAVLKRRIAERPIGYLYPNGRDDSRPLPSPQKAHDDALRISGVARFRLYDLRHTFATRAAEGGMDLVTLAAVLGHSRIQMVMRYAHPTQLHQAMSMAKVNAHKIEQRELERHRNKAEQERTQRPGMHIVKRSA